MIPHTHFPRSSFDMDKWFQPSIPGGLTTLDAFDAFDELDHMMARNMQWLAKPEFAWMAPQPRVPQKYRVIVDCTGYSPEAIKTEIVGHQLIVSGLEEAKHTPEGDYSKREFKRSYTLPETVEKEKMVSFMTANGELVIEMPMRESQPHLNVDLLPKIVDAPNGGKQVQLKFNVPANIKPEHVHVSIKDRDLIVKAEEKVEKPDGISKFFYYKRTTLPENTDFKRIKCDYDNHKIAVSAPLCLDFKPMHRKVPIEFGKKH